MSEKKCNKFEELFIKEDESELLEHIKVCPECALKYEKFNKVSKLVKEVAFGYRKREKSRKNIYKIAASFLFLFASFLTIQFAMPDSFVNHTIASLSNDYTFEQMGLPVDEYGFIMVDFDK